MVSIKVSIQSADSSVVPVPLFELEWWFTKVSTHYYLYTEQSHDDYTPVKLKSEATAIREKQFLFQEFQ